MQVLAPRWPTYAVLSLATLLFKLFPYVLMRLGTGVDQTLASYPWNFSPVLAFCLYSGATLPRRSASLWFPLSLWLVGDLGIWALTGRFDWAFYPAQGAVYLGLVTCAACGWLLRSGFSWPAVFATAMVASSLFFVTTNFACWLSDPATSHALAGLWTCYREGLPHARHTTFATLLFSGLMFSPLGVRWTALAAPAQPAPAP